MWSSWLQYTICTKMYNILFLYENVQIIESARYRANGKKGSNARPRGFPVDASVGVLAASAAKQQIRPEQRQDAKGGCHQGVHGDEQIAFLMTGKHVHRIVVHDVPKGQGCEHNRYAADDK